MTALTVPNSRLTVFASRVQVDAWSENICEGVLKKLSGMKKNYKYVVTTTLTQKCGAGIHISRASIMDQDKDMIVKVDYESNPTISCMVAVYCLAI